MLGNDLDKAVESNLSLLNIIVIKEHMKLAREAWQLEIRKRQQEVFLELLKSSIVTRYLPMKVSSVIVVRYHCNDHELHYHRLRAFYATLDLANYIYT